MSWNFLCLQMTLLNENILPENILFAKPVFTGSAIVNYSLVRQGGLLIVIYFPTGFT